MASVGDKVIVMCNLYGYPTRGRQAIIIDIDRLYEIGAYPDRYTVRMRKSGMELDCTADVLANTLAGQPQAGKESRRG